MNVLMKDHWRYKMLTKKQKKELFKEALNRYCSDCGTLCTPYKTSVSFDPYNAQCSVTIWHKCEKKLFGIFPSIHSDECSTRSNVIISTKDK